MKFVYVIMAVLLLTACSKNDEGKDTPVIEQYHWGMRNGQAWEYQLNNTGKAANSSYNFSVGYSIDDNGWKRLRESIVFNNFH